MIPEAIIKTASNPASTIFSASEHGEFEGATAVRLTVVDASVINAEQLISQFAQTTEVLVLDAGDDGIQQITEALLKYDRVSSLNVVSHGQSGQIQLGNSTINLRSLAQYADRFRSWQQALTDHADILFYGCHVAAGQAGTDFIDRLAQLTGADIAASTNLTGNRSLGGDWTLEYSTGDIESDLGLRLGKTEPYELVLNRPNSRSVDPSSQQHRNTGDVQLGAGNIYRENLFELNSLTKVGLDIARVPVHRDQYWDGSSATPEDMDEIVLSALSKGIQPVLIFEYYTKKGEPLGDRNQWRAIGQAFAERFRPNSAWLRSRGIANVGIEHYTAINEPLSGHNPTPIGVPQYVKALEGLADGVKAVKSELQVAAGGFMEQHLFSGNNPYIKALVPLYNSGKLDAIDIHRYWDVSWVPMEGTRKFSLQSQFETLIRDLGITADTGFWTTEINFKKRLVSETEAASGLLTALWDALGVINPNTGKRATEFVMPWGMLHSRHRDNYFGMSFNDNSWGPTSRGIVVDLVDELSAGMKFDRLDPHDRGEYTLRGAGKVLRVWQNREGWSSVSGKSYTLNGLPPNATKVEIYGWDGLRQTVQLNGKTSLTLDNLPTEETLMFLIHTGNETIKPVNDNPTANDDPVKDDTVKDETVKPVTDNPTAGDDSIDVDEGDAVKIAVLANDSDPDGDSLSIKSFTQPKNGTVVDRGDGTFTYRPKWNFSGSDRFTYTIGDGRGNTDSATVNITVTPSNDRPQADNDWVKVRSNNTVKINVLRNDSDSGSGKKTLFVKRFSKPSHGIVVARKDGTLVYAPKWNFSGRDRFTYTIGDGEGGTDTAIVTINVKRRKKGANPKLIDLNRNKWKAADRRRDNPQVGDSASDVAFTKRQPKWKRRKNRYRRRLRHLEK